MPADPRSAPPADWYLDPEAPTRGRYWDGATWTTDVVDIPDGLTLAAFPSPGRRRQRQSRSRAVLVAAAVVALVGCAGVAGWWVRDDDGSEVKVAGTTVIRLRGSVDLRSAAFIGREPGDGCRGEDELEDVAPGLRIAVRAPDGTTVAAPRLERGRLVAADAQLPDELGALIPMCRLTFDCELPADPASPTYEIAIDGYGSQTWTRDELEESGWTARLAITD